MIIENIENLQFIDSFIVGWDINEKQISIYLEVILLESHKYFQPFKEKNDFACYKNCILLINEYTKCLGFPCKKQEKVWDKQLKEYSDFGEIDSFNIEKKESKLSIEADDLCINIYGIKKLSIRFE